MGCSPGLICIFRDLDHFQVLSGAVRRLFRPVNRVESGRIEPMYGHRFSEKAVNGREDVS